MTDETTAEQGWPRRVELPRGGWAVLRDPELVPDRLRRPIARLRRKAMATAMGAGLTPEMARDMTETGDGDGAEAAAADRRVAVVLRMVEADAAGIDEEFADHLVAALVVEWSYDEPITAEAVADLPGAALDVLAKECMRHLPRLFPSFEPDESEASPTSPSRGSRPRSRASRSTSTASSPRAIGGSASTRSPA